MMLTIKTHRDLENHFDYVLFETIQCTKTKIITGVYVILNGNGVEDIFRNALTAIND